MVSIDNVAAGRSAKIATDRLPASWCVVELSEICDLTMGQSPPGETYNETGEGIPFIQGKAEFGDIYPSLIKWCTAPQRIAEKDDVLVSVRAPVGPTNLSPGTICIGRGLGALRPLGGIESRFVLYALRATVDKLVDQSSGSTFASISKATLVHHRIALPPVAEQRRIVAAIEEQFSRLDAAVASLERARANLKRYRAAVLQAALRGELVPKSGVLAFASSSDGLPLYPTGQSRIAPEPTPKKKQQRAGRLWGSGSVPSLTDEEREALPNGWTWTKVRYLGSNPDETVQVGPMSMRSKDFVDHGVPVLNVGCVQWRHIDESKLQYLPDELVKGFTRYRLAPGDVLFTRSGTVGRCAVVGDRHDGWLMTFHLLRARPDLSICDPRFLQISLEGAPHIRRQTKDASIGTTRAGFNTNLLADLDIALPPLSVQKRIVAEVERRFSVIDSIETNIGVSLKRAQRLRQAILKRAFAGELVPQDPSDEAASVLLERIRAERAPFHHGRAKKTKNKSVKQAVML